MKNWIQVAIGLCACASNVQIAQAAEVKFKVTAEGAKPSTFKALIYKGGPGEKKSFVTMIENDELVSVMESTCTQSTIYSAQPVAAALYQSNPTDMHTCRDGAEITFRFAMRHVASKADYIIYFKTDNEKDWNVGPALEPAITELKYAYSSGELGKAVKLSTELSTEFSKSGDTVKAEAFRNLTIATTRDYVYSLSPDVAPPEDAGLAKWKGRLEMTPETKQKLVEFQQSCGAGDDNGKLGWKTMSCMPGGKDVALQDYFAKPGGAR